MKGTSILFVKLLRKHLYHLSKLKFRFEAFSLVIIIDIVRQMIAIYSYPSGCVWIFMALMALIKFIVQ